MLKLTECLFVVSKPPSRTIACAKVEGECDAALPTGDAAESLTITVGAPKLGRVFDYLDNPLDGLGPLPSRVAEAEVRRLPVFNAEPAKGSTTSLNRGLHTGVTAVDALTPLGRGQTMLVRVWGLGMIEVVWAVIGDRLVKYSLLHRLSSAVKGC